MEDIPGLGHLYTYDTALRIGSKLVQLPNKVYLHAGTRRGARILGLDWKASALEIAEIPIELRELEPFKIEDFLCVYEDELSDQEKSDEAVEIPIGDSGTDERFRLRCLR